MCRLSGRGGVPIGKQPQRSVERNYAAFVDWSIVGPLVGVAVGLIGTLLAQFMMVRTNSPALPAAVPNRRGGQSESNHGRQVQRDAGCCCRTTVLSPVSAHRDQDGNQPAAIGEGSEGFSDHRAERAAAVRPAHRVGWRR